VLHLPSAKGAVRRRHTAQELTNRAAGTRPNLRVFLKNKTVTK
jgi:hypothetical protein